VNRVIYNMLYDNSGYTNFLNSWGKVHSYLAFFARITAKIANGIQSVLKAMYGFINKNYMGLSREMEFHADAVAASVAGGNNLISSLSRIEIANECYQSALGNANAWLKENKVSRNIFNNQLVILQSWAAAHQLPLKQGLPEVSYQFIQSISKSRINYKNQWASHPTLEERKTHLEKLDINVAPEEASAWILFDHPGQLQEQMTGVLYLSVKMETPFETLDASNFEETHAKERDKYKLPEAYQGFYTGRYIEMNDWEIDNLVATNSDKTFDQLFNRENGSLQTSINSNTKDLTLVRAIKEKQIQLKTFDFDGVKYEWKDCDAIIEQLEKEIKADQDQLNLLDKEAFAFFYAAAKEKAEEIKNGYIHFQSVSKEFDEYLDTANRIMTLTQPFYEGGLTLVRINADLVELKKLEIRLKSSFGKLISAGILEIDSKAALCDQTKAFVLKDYAYFVSNQFVDSELNELRDLCFKVYAELGDYKFRVYKDLLEGQLGVVGR
jgi:hypothetical protein